MLAGRRGRPGDLQPPVGRGAAVQRLDLAVGHQLVERAVGARDAPLGREGARPLGRRAGDRDRTPVRDLAQGWEGRCPRFAFARDGKRRASKLACCERFAQRFHGRIYTRSARSFSWRSDERHWLSTTLAERDVTYFEEHEPCAKRTRFSRRKLLRRSSKDLFACAPRSHCALDTLDAWGDR